MRMITKRHILAVTLIGSLGVAGSGVPASAEQPPLLIGAVTPNSGAMAVLGDDLARSYELAADRVNATGGVMGRKVVIIRGDATNAQEGISAVEKLVGRDKVDIVTGTIASFISVASSDAAINYNVLYWETNALAKELTERGLPNFARSGPSSDNFAKVSVDGTIDLFAKQIGKAPSALKVLIEHEDSAYGTAIAKEQKRLFEAVGAKVELSPHSLKSIDMSDAVLRAKKMAPDIWISAGYVVDTNLLLRTAREQGFKPPVTILVGVGDTKETADAIGTKDLEGMLVVTYPRFQVNPAYGPGAAEFYKAYEAKFGAPPVAPSGISGYVGLRILFQAIEAAHGSTKYEDVLAAAKAMDVPVGSYETGYGVKFDDHMQNTRAVPIISQWQDGKIVVVYPVAAALPGTTLHPLGRN